MESNGLSVKFWPGACIVIKKHTWRYRSHDPAKGRSTHDNLEIFLSKWEPERRWSSAQLKDNYTRMREFVQQTAIDKGKDFIQALHVYTSAWRELYLAIYIEEQKLVTASSTQSERGKNLYLSFWFNLSVFNFF